MARESFNSRQQRHDREQDPLASGQWKLGVFDVVKQLKRSGVTEVREGDAVAEANGWTQEHLRRMCTGTGGMGLFYMRSEFNDGPVTALNPSGSYFVGYVFEIA